MKTDLSGRSSSPSLTKAKKRGSWFPRPELPDYKMGPFGMVSSLLGRASAVLISGRERFERIAANEVVKMNKV